MPACFFPPQPVGARHTMSWFWAPLIVKAHYQSLGDRSGPAQRLPALRIIWALDRKLLLWHTQKARDSVKEHFCLTLWAQWWRSIPKVSLLVAGCHQWEKGPKRFLHHLKKKEKKASSGSILSSVGLRRPDLWPRSYQCLSLTGEKRICGFRDWIFVIFCFLLELKVWRSPVCSVN